MLKEIFKKFFKKQRLHKKSIVEKAVTRIPVAKNTKSLKKAKKIVKKKVDTKSEEKFQREKEELEIKKYSEFLEDLNDNFEQKRAVISDSKRILVLAGAGSGKTKVLTKKFIHLIKNKGIPKEKIMALTFTKSASEEMKERISKALNIKSEHLHNNVRTIHSFCFSILKQNEQFALVTEKEQREIVERILIELSKNEEIMQSMYNYIRDNLFEKIKKRDAKDERNPQFKDKPDHFGTKKIKTANGILVRSKSERDIANFLTAMGLNWEYEKPVDFGEGTFYPDFFIEDSIYLEHWCYDEKTPEFSKIDKEKYLKNRSWKEKQYQKEGKHLISIEEREMLDFQQLQKRLIGEIEKLVNKKVGEIKILELLDISPTSKISYVNFIDELIEIINLAKSRFLETKDIKELIKNKKKEKVLDFYNVLIPVMTRYEDILKRIDYSKKDFNDLIWDAFNLLKKNDSRREYYQNRIEYLLIDEFQDVSHGEVELLKQLVNKKTSFFAVGDDWQSIYGWRGSDVDHILNFEKDFGKTEKIILPINYRSKKNIVDASNHFIQLSKNMYKKDIKCSPENEIDSELILQLNAMDDFNGGRYVIHKIKQLMLENPSLKISDFLVLFRSSRILGGYKKIFDQQDLKIPLQTIHWSKGKESEYVFVLGLKGGLYGFPNIYVDKDIRKVIHDNPIEKKEEEERRLFYVAMTRAKKRLFFISENDNESEFVTQIPNDYKYIMRPRG